MNILLFLSIALSVAWSRSVILVSDFDAFGNAEFNNSNRVAKILKEQLQDHPDFELKLCHLNTVYDKAFYQLQDCFKALSEPPKMVLGLGESNCNMKIETMARNLDKSYGPDNDGIERMSQSIIPGAPEELGLTYPLAEMYCSIDPQRRKDLEISNDAGSFVCNNLMFQFAAANPEVSFGFIHVPANQCKNLPAKTEVTVANLTKMLEAAVKSTLVKPLATRKKDLEILRRSSKDNKCLNEFYGRTKGFDEKGFRLFLRTN